MICHKLSNVIFSFMLTIHALLFNIKILMKFICGWFENICDNKLSIHFGDDKTKSILFATKLKIKSVRKLNIRHRDIQIKGNSKVKYLGCIVDETMAGETIALSVINKINNKLKFLGTIAL